VRPNNFFFYSTNFQSSSAQSDFSSHGGRALEIGGVKEKVIGAHRAGIKQIILPKDNKKDLEDIPASVKHDLKFYFASHLDDVLKLALRLTSGEKVEALAHRQFAQLTTS
jgi:predicted ATP-dependent protease